MKEIIEGRKFDTETAHLIYETDLTNGYFGGNPATKGKRYKALIKRYKMLDIDLPVEAIKEISTAGSNDEAVSFWHDELNLSKIVKLKDAKNIVKSQISDFQHKSARAYREYALWLTAWTQFEENKEDLDES